MEVLTRRQREIFNFLRDNADRFVYPPSLDQPLRDRSRVVPRNDSACVFTKRSVVKMQALRNRVESLESM